MVSRLIIHRDEYLSLLPFLVSTTLSSVYSSQWTPGSPKFSRLNDSAPEFNYQRIQLNLTTPGLYTFRTRSNLHTCGLLYRKRFYSTTPWRNLVTSDDGASEFGQFEFRSRLRLNVTYLLIATTFDPNVRGGFDVIIDGPARVGLSRTM